MAKNIWNLRRNFVFLRRFVRAYTYHIRVLILVKVIKHNEQLYQMGELLGQCHIDHRP